MSQHHLKNLNDQCEVKCIFHQFYYRSTVYTFVPSTSANNATHMLVALHSSIPYYSLTFMTSFLVKSTRGKEDSFHYNGWGVSFDLEEIGSALMESFSDSPLSSKEAETMAAK